jgi:hypothetical protein
MDQALRQQECTQIKTDLTDQSICRHNLLFRLCRQSVNLGAIAMPVSLDTAFLWLPVRWESSLQIMDTSLPDRVATVITPNLRVFVIPGLTRNPVLCQRFALLDAESSPA